MNDVSKRYFVVMNLNIYVDAFNEKDLNEKLKPLKKYLRDHETLDIEINDFFIEED